MCGLSAVETIHAATGAVAEALGCADRFGTIRPGRAADLVAVRGDVAADIRHLGRVESVLQAGTITHRPRE